MREIKFRGKRVDNGEWAYGGVAFYNGDKPHIISGLYPIEIYEESLGQFTGLKDKNGVKIYEGDVFKNINTHGDYIDDTFTITFENGKFGFFNYSIFDHDIECENIEIIGNIHKDEK